jgi:hypothetical protein
MENSMTYSQTKKLPLLSWSRTPKHAHVPRLKAMLRSQGFWDGSNSQAFGPLLDVQVRAFQTAHLGPDGQYLLADGVVGAKTWWALYHPSGEAQRSHIVPVTAGNTTEFQRRFGMLSQQRQAFIRLAFQEHAAGVREIPDGSNQGDGVDKYIAGFGPAPWCALFVSWLFRQVTGRWPNNRRHAHVQTGWNEAIRLGRVFTGKDRLPLPGDLPIWHFTRGRGHVSVLVASDARCQLMNTIGGNEGNRVKLGRRTLSRERELVGFIDLFGERQGERDVVRQLLFEGDTGSLTAGGSR